MDCADMIETSEEYLHNLFNALNEAVFVYDQDMRIKYFNTTAEKITGHKKTEVIGGKCVTLFDGSLCLNNCALCMTAKNGAAKSKISFESSFIKKDGSRRKGKFQTSLLERKSGRGLEVLVALTDITEISALKDKLKGVHRFRDLVGKSPLMKDLFHSIKNIAGFETNVLIQGESGTGKELVAQALHHESPRAGKKLIVVHCASFSESLLESELFGHVKGAFTGASSNRIGRFEEGSGGTIFLDEVGELEPRVQVKLLRVIQEKEIQRVGCNQNRKVDIRIIAATNKDLLQEVKEGRFREDLYYRLNVVPIHLPPLRIRKEDIPELSRHFVNQFVDANSKIIHGFSTAALGMLMDHDWPGNVRELGNAVEHACVKCSREIIDREDLPINIPRAQTFTKGKKRNTLTRDNVQTALEQTGNNQTRAAKKLGVHRITLWRKMKELNLPSSKK
jgi:PAS domain S-box-containing protein